MSAFEDLPHTLPDVLASVRDDLANWNAWFSRAIILVYAAAAGLCIVAFIRLPELALHDPELLERLHADLSVLIRVLQAEGADPHTPLAEL